MKRIPLPFLPALFAVALLSGCGHLDLAGTDDVNRVLTGTVDFSAPTELPDDAIVLVRVVDAIPQTQRANDRDSQPQTLKRLVPPADAPPEVLGEKTIVHPGAAPIPFRVEYQADDEQLQHGLNIEARVSVGGKVRFYNFNHYAIGISDYTSPQTILVDPVTR